MHKQESLKDPQVGFVECGYGDGDAQHREKQEDIWIAHTKLPSAPGHPFYQRLNELASAASRNGIQRPIGRTNLLSRTLSANSRSSDGSGCVRTRAIFTVGFWASALSGRTAACVPKGAALPYLRDQLRRNVTANGVHYRRTRTNEAEFGGPLYKLENPDEKRVFNGDICLQQLRTYCPT